MRAFKAILFYILISIAIIIFVLSLICFSKSNMIKGSLGISLSILNIISAIVIQDFWNEDD